MSVSRRSFLKSAGVVAGSALVVPAVAQMPTSNNQAETPSSSSEKVDYTIRIAAPPWKSHPKRSSRVTTYNAPHMRDEGCVAESAQSTNLDRRTCVSCRISLSMLDYNTILRAATC